MTSTAGGQHEAEVSGTMSASRLEMGNVTYEVEKQLRELVDEVDGPADVSVKIEVTESE